jgi:hypothetical protein
MALYFEIRLTHVQMSLLRIFQEWVDKDRPSDSSPFGDGRFQSFVGSVKGLCREGLLVHHENKSGKKILTSKESSALWDITPKGRALLQVIECELKAASKAQKRIPNSACQQLVAAEAK